MRRMRRMTAVVLPAMMAVRLRVELEGVDVEREGSGEVRVVD